MNLKSLITDRSKKDWCVLAILLIIVVLGFWVRSFPARFNELQAIDPFYIYRMSEYVVNNNFQLPENDMLRHHPFGVPPAGQPPVAFYLPAIMYVVIGPLTGLGYFQYALLYPALMGALASIVMFFIGKELFDRKTGLFAAFFLATIPAFITRTSAGFFDKEANAGVLMLMLFYFFIRAYKRNCWKSGILGGISMFFLVQTWAGGVQYIALLIPAFIIVMLLLNRNISRISKAYIPLAVGMMANVMMPYHPNILGFSIYGTVPMVLVLLLARMGVERYGLVKKDQMAYVVPGIIVVGILGLLFASMFTDAGAEYLTDVGRVVTLSKNVEFSTVAEANPGSWGAIEGVTRASYATQVLPIPGSIVWLFSINTFLLIGMFLA
ncbi:MAG: hypothetical protein DRO99_01925, partial [Candidatus Aenigmatarchaeota archaeon]